MIQNNFGDNAAILANQLVSLNCIPCDINGVAYSPKDNLFELKTLSILLEEEKPHSSAGTAEVKKPRKMIGTIDISTWREWKVFLYGENNRSQLSGILKQLVEWNLNVNYTIQMISQEERQEFRC